jgi:hypothetical protein
LDGNDAGVGLKVWFSQQQVLAGTQSVLDLL